MPEETVMDLAESLLRQRDPEAALMSETDLDAVTDGEVVLRPAAAKRAFSALGGLARRDGGHAGFRVVGKYAAFVLDVAAGRDEIWLTLLDAGSGDDLCRCLLRRYRDRHGTIAYDLVLMGGSSPFGVLLTDAVLQAALRKGGLALA